MGDIRARGTRVVGGGGGGVDVQFREMTVGDLRGISLGWVGNKVGKQSELGAGS